jgi:hypothetical protein
MRIPLELEELTDTLMIFAWQLWRLLRIISRMACPHLSDN